MRSELEQEFYDTFGIEPEFGYWCKRFDETSIADCNGIKEPSKKCAKCENGYIKYRYYPVITAEKLLEMICILNDYEGVDVQGTTIEELKEELLNQCIEYFKYPIAFEENADLCNLHNKIQQLFKEDNQ